MVPGYAICLASGSAAGAALNTSVAQTSILHSSGVGAIPGGMLQVGSVIRIRLRGTIGATGTPTITFAVKIGSATATALGAFTAAAATNISFQLDIECAVRAVGTGTSANFAASATLQALTFTGSTGNILLPATGGPVVGGTGWDSTVSNTIDVTAQWSASSASNTIQVITSLIEVFQ